jgi:hypothetical protein
MAANYRGDAELAGVSNLLRPHFPLKSPLRRSNRTNPQQQVVANLPRWRLGAGHIPYWANVLQG